MVYCTQGPRVLKEIEMGPGERKFVNLLGFPHLQPVQGFSRAGFSGLSGLSGALEQLTSHMNPFPSDLESDVKVMSM